MFTGEYEYRLRRSKIKNIRRVFGRLSLMRDTIYMSLSSVVVFFLKCLPTRMISMVKEKIVIVIKMPYSKRVLVDIDTYKEIRRAAFCFRELDTLRWIEDCADSGGVLYDVGANIGAVSMLYAANIKARFGNVSEGQVIAFEPSFSTFSKLCKNIYINNLGGKVLPFSFPLSIDVKGDIFKFSGTGIGSSGHSLSGSEEANAKFVMELPVLTLSIDYIHYHLGFQAPRWLKIDVDGHDLKVLKGAHKVIGEGFVKSILIEKNGDETEIRNFLEPFGFKEITIGMDGLDEINLRFER